MLIVGDREEEDHAVSVRLRSNEDLGSLPVYEALEIIREAVANSS